MKNMRGVKRTASNLALLPKDDNGPKTADGNDLSNLIKGPKLVGTGDNVKEREPIAIVTPERPPTAEGVDPDAVSRVVRRGMRASCRCSCSPSPSPSSSRGPRCAT